MIRPFLNNSPSLDELSESYGVVACLFLGSQLNTWSLFPTLCNGRERLTLGVALDKAEEEEEEEEEEELYELSHHIWSMMDFGFKN